LAGSPLISQPTTERVREAAQALKYRSDHIGRALRSRTTLSIGLVVPNIRNPFFPALVQAVEVEAKRNGWSMLLADSLDSVALEQENLDLLIGRRVDAVVISPLHRTRSRGSVLAAAENVPVIQVDRLASGRLPFVGVDQAGAMTAVLDHLADTGRSRVAYIGANTGESTAAERLQAFRAWAAARAVDGRATMTDSTPEDGMRAVARLLGRRADVDAIACCNDAIAIGVLAELNRRGIDVPAEIAVTGFDDTVVSRVCRPHLTTVGQPLVDVAVQAVAWAQSPPPRGTPAVRFPARLFPRASTMPSLS
jgi:LacI family transcriptional regulator